MNIVININGVFFNDVERTPTNTLLPFYSEKVDMIQLLIELNGTPYAYYINDLTLNGVEYDAIEGFIIDYYNLINEIY